MQYRPRMTARDHRHPTSRARRSGRPRRLVLAVLSAALVASSLVGGTGTAAAATGSAAYERGLVAHLNKVRDAKGLRPLRVDACADVLSEALATRMRRKRRALQISPERVARECDRRLILQVVALTPASPRAVVRGWLKQRTTRTVLLRAGTRRVGVGTVRDGSGRWYVSLLVVGSTLLSSAGTTDGSGTGSTDGTTTDGTLTPEGSAILDETNLRRTANGLAPLLASTCATAFATRHSDTMASNDQLAHSDLSALQSDCSATDAAENVAVAQSTTLDVTAVVDAWMASDLHRANILDPTLTLLGVGVAHNSSTGRWYVTQDFLAQS